MRALFIFVLAHIGAGLGLLAGLYIGPDIWPDSNLSGLGGMVIGGPLGFLLGGMTGWLMSVETKTRRG